MRILVLTLTFLLGLLASPSLAKEKTIGVFVALADNKYQGIARVPAAIGDGEEPERNLYWGNSEGLKGYFDQSRRWKRIARSDTPTGDILRTRTYRHVSGHAVLHARAYRGRAMRLCITDFEAAVQRGSYDMVVFIGHNGLMDFTLPPLTKSPTQARHPDCVVLCCKSADYFQPRLTAAGGRPLLLTTQFMYPGSFILAAAAESWLDGAKCGQIRASAGAAYARNQKISRRAATGMFSALKD